MANVKPQISLQKMPLKNFIVYRKTKRTPTQYDAHQLFLMQRQKNINNSKKTKQMVKEEENFREIPEIDQYQIKL